VLVFYIGNILVDKNTLCNGYVLRGWLVFNSESSCIQIMIKSKTITNHKLLKDVHQESLQNPRQKQNKGNDRERRPSIQQNKIKIKIERKKTHKQPVGMLEFSCCR
jgi:hypothetical protein